MGGYYYYPTVTTNQMALEGLFSCNPTSKFFCCKIFQLQAPPYFIILIFVEAFILWYNHNTVVRINDAIGSMSGGLMMQFVEEIVLRGFEVSVYVWIHTNYSLIQLPWDSPITWWACFLGYDFIFYWFHRMAHGQYILCTSTSK